MRRLLLAAGLLSATTAYADHTNIYDDDVTSFISGKRIDPAKSGNLTIFVCEEHFPPGSTARDEVYRSVQAFNEGAGAKVHLKIKYGPHKKKAALYASPPQYDFSFEYVDNVDTVGDPGFNPCHANGSLSCGDWTMNTCHYDGVWPAAGNISSHTVFAVNSHCYAPLDMSRPHPTAAGITHELGHGFGLKHAMDRTVEGDEYQTIMAQDLDWLTSYDLAHLMNYYPSSAPTEIGDIETAEWAVSNVLRYYDSTGALISGTFAALNPTDLYLQAGQFMDCDTGAPPIYQANFMEMSTAAYDPTNGSGLACFSVATAATGWLFDCVFSENVSTVTANGDMSQILISSFNLLWPGLFIPSSTFTTNPLPNSQPAKVQFVMDYYDDFGERNEQNNTVEMDIELHKNASFCP